MNAHEHTLTTPSKLRVYHSTTAPESFTILIEGGAFVKYTFCQHLPPFIESQLSILPDQQTDTLHPCRLTEHIHRLNLLTQITIGLINLQISG